MYIATKTIDWALNPPKNDRLFLREGKEVEGLNDEALAERLLDMKYIKHVVEVVESKESAYHAELSTEETLLYLVADIKKNDDKKDALEDWGKENAGVDIDRRKSVKNIIKELVEIVG